MLDFIFVPLVVGIITLGIYKLFELFARRKERLLMIEKMSENIDFSKYNEAFPSLSSPIKLNSYGTLKIGCLLVGLGLGIFVGFLISHTYELDNRVASLVFGSLVLFFGGVSLLISFMIEQRLSKKDSLQ